MEAQKYPIGRFTLPEPDPQARIGYVKELGAFPERLRTAIDELVKKDRLDATYRPGGWSAQQVIHHLADSHLHAYRRHKVILVEDHPTLVPYNQDEWAKLPDVMAVPVWASLDILKGIHLRLAVLLTQCTDEQWARTGYHPASGITYTLESLSAQYVWHGNHHLAHLDLIRSK